MMAKLMPSTSLLVSMCLVWSCLSCLPNIGQRQSRTTTQSSMEQKLRWMRMGALCCGDNKQDKNESTITHLPACQSFKLLQVPSNIKHLRKHSWHVMHLISPPHLGRYKLTLRRCWSEPSWICSQGRHQSTCWWKQAKWWSKLQWQSNQDKQRVNHKTARKSMVQQTTSWPYWHTFSPILSLDNEDLEEISTLTDDDQAELMSWHFCLGHLPSYQLKQFSKNDKIPKKLAKTMPPLCAGCLFGAMTKVPWQPKDGDTGKQVFKATKAGRVVSVDQMISTQKGFIVPLKSKLTKHCYKAATIFVYHF